MKILFVKDLNLYDENIHNEKCDMITSDVSENQSKLHTNSSNDIRGTMLLAECYCCEIN